jgi:hypothetical protein
MEKEEGIFELKERNLCKFLIEWVNERYSSRMGIDLLSELSFLFGRGLDN